MNKKKITWVPVVAGIIQKDQKVLLGLRPQGKNLPGLWEFPGGKIEIGESPETALARELKEELEITADIDKLKLVGTHSYGEVGIVLIFYDVKFWKGSPKANHHSELKWVNKEELMGLELPEANKKLLPQIIETLF